MSYSHLVKIPEPHSLNGGGLPFRQGRHELDGWWLLLHDPQRKSAQHSVTLVNKRLCGGASIYSDHLTT